MGEKIFIGAPLTKGLSKFLLPFNIDNDAFPTLFNFYTWRGRAKRKRGTVKLGRLTKQEQIAAVPLSWQLPTFALVAGAGNLISQFSLDSSGSIVPKSISLTVNGKVYTDPNADGTLTATGGSGTINYATGGFTIVSGGTNTVIGTFSYYPDLPVMGLEDYVRNDPTLPFSISQYPLLLAFDTKYSYQISASSSSFYGTNFYKGTNNPVVWSGANYQQFWTTNYQGALWATNGKPGFHFVNATYTSGSGTALITFNFKSLTVNYASLIVGDKIFFNEWSGSTINGLVGTVSTATDAVNGNYVVTFSGNQTVTGTGIGQLLTSSISGQDGIRWYDGDPTGGTGLPVGNGLGWVNFAPPLTATTVSIDDQPALKYYLVGASVILPFKDRLVFFAPWIQSSNGTAAFQLNDVAMWSWNGTPYYESVTPLSQTFDPTAYYVDQTGKGGWLSSGFDQLITTVSTNEDVLLVGFTQKQTRFVYTGNDLFPFLFYITNSELGSASTFSAITLDRGVLSFGINGLTLATQIGCQRIDLDIPDQVFQIKGPATVHAAERISSARDFYREWVYFTFVPNESQWSFPTLTLQYNYREESWGIHYENFTAHGTYRRQTGYTWATIPFRTWNTWRESWNSATTTALFPSVIAGNPQGFVVVKGEGTGEAPTGYISAISNASGLTQITSNDHCVKVGDYLYFQGSIGVTYLNNVIARVDTIVDANNFVLDVAFQAGTYLGLGVFTRLIQPFLQTKQFAPYWNEGRQVRLGVQKYLLDYTDDAQVTLNIYLSQNPDTPYNFGPIIPNESLNNSLVYSDILFTSPEANNLQTPTASSQYQIWHRMNTSLIGESFQLGITLSDAQMRNLDYATAEITVHAIQVDVDKGPINC